MQVFYTKRPAPGAAPLEFWIKKELPEGVARRNYEDEPHSVTINDLRIAERPAQLHVNGACALQLPVPQSSESAAHRAWAQASSWCPSSSRLA